MAYNQNTNWDNEKKYLTNLINSGSSGQKAWAENQIGKLNSAQAQYTNTSSTPTQQVTQVPQGNKPTSTQANTGSTVKVSYNNKDYDIDLNKDYSIAIEEARKKGDYATAAQNEAYRNAKINYLNENNSNTYNAQISNDYGNYKSFSDLPDTWTSAIVGGNTYTKDETGRMYNEAGSFLGDGYNAVTNEFTFTDDNDAMNSMFSSLKAQHGLENYSDEDAINYLKGQGVWNTDYFNAFKNGTVSEYNALMQQKAREEEERLAALAELESAKRQYEEQLILQREEEQRKMDEWLAELEKINQQKTINKNAYTDFIKSRLRKNFIY